MAFFSRMVRAAKLDPHLYEEVEKDKSATTQAAVVVMLGSLAAGIGAANEGVTETLITIVLALVGWAVWAFLNYWLGTTKLFRESTTQADWGQLARAMGFAYTPRLLMVLAIIPVAAIAAIITFIAIIWSWVAMVVAVRQALDYHSIWRAVGVTLIGFILNVIIVGVVAGILLSGWVD